MSNLSLAVLNLLFDILFFNHLASIPLLQPSGAPSSCTELRHDPRRHFAGSEGEYLKFKPSVIRIAFLYIKHLTQELTATRTMLAIVAGKRKQHGACSS